MAERITKQSAYQQLEAQRQQLQIELDQQKSQQQRNRLGQFATPHELAMAIATQSLQYSDANEVSFLDPAIGTGAFYSAVELTANQSANNTKISKATGFELDPHYAKPAVKLWQNTKLKLQIGDFTHIADTASSANESYNLIICNPPYIRHHHITQDKKQLQQLAKSQANMSLSGRAGSHCYFMALAHQWMSKSAIGAWLIPSEFMDVNYGQGVKDYLLNQVSLLHIHRFDAANSQFNDALVSSALVWFKNQKPTKHHTVRLSFGDLCAPSQDKILSIKALSQIQKWTQAFENKPPTTTNKDDKTLGDLFTIKRGLATGANDFFILSKKQIEQLRLPISQFRPMLPSPRQLTNDIIDTDKNGYPVVTQNLNEGLFVLDCHLTMDEIKNQYPALFDYLQQGIELGIDQRYLCRHRKLWYRQENRPTSHFYCSYIGRPDNSKNKKPFKFVLNYSDTIVTNSYLILYPKKVVAEQIANDKHVVEQIHQMLMLISRNDLLAQARVYGGGMVKLEPMELARVRCGGY